MAAAEQGLLVYCRPSGHVPFLAEAAAARLFFISQMDVISSLTSATEEKRNSNKEKYIPRIRQKSPNFALGTHRTQGTAQAAPSECNVAWYFVHSNIPT